MTLLLGTKTSSTPVGDAPGGGERAARSLLSCALWRGMGRLWRGMGGMGRAEPLSAHRPHQQQGLSGFHETRDPRPEARQLPGARRKPARIPRFSRITNHESRLLCFPAHDFPAFPAISRLKILPMDHCQRIVSRSCSASRQAPFAAAPVALRARSIAANAKRTHAEKGGRSRLRRQPWCAI